jgi:enoyl-[acyl-carrier protein] reductase III
MSLQGKRALVTGAGRGIGRGIALALAAQGCAVAIHYARKRSEAEATAADVAAYGVPAPVLRANLAHTAEARQLVTEATGQLGGLDILIANAASGVAKSILAVEEKDWDWTVTINAESILVAAQTAAAGMQAQRWGRIVAITSSGSRRAIPHYGVVGVSKAAQEALVRYLAAELASYGVTVNCVSPGLVLTDALAAFPSVDAMLDDVKRRTPAGRLVTPEDIGNVVAWLCSDAAAMIVGQTIEVDGGYGIVTMA